MLEMVTVAFGKVGGTVKSFLRTVVISLPEKSLELEREEREREREKKRERERERERERLINNCINDTIELATVYQELVLQLT